MILAILVIIVVLMCTKANAIWTIKIDTVSACQMNNLLPLQINSVKVHTVNDILMVNGKIELNETIKSPLQVTYSLERCDSAWTNCVEYPAVTERDGCVLLKFLSTKDPNFNATILPILLCPLKPQPYIFRDYKFNFSFIKNYPMPESKYKLKIRGYTLKNAKKRLIFCFQSLGAVLSRSIRKPSTSSVTKSKVTQRTV